MKVKTFFLTALTLAMVSCSNDEPISSNAEILDNSDKIIESKSATRSIEEAAEIAIRGIQMIESDKPGSRAISVGRTFSLKNVKAITVENNSRSGEGDTIMYVFNFDNEEGFAIVAIDKLVDGLMAVAEKGSLSMEDSVSNIGVADYVARAKEYLIKKHDELIKSKLLSRAGDDIVDDLAGYRILHDTIFSETKRPKYFLNWGQNCPEGEYCPNHLAGCVNVAIALSMANFGLGRTIDKLPLTYKNSGDTLNLPWTNLRKHIQSGQFPSMILMDGCDERDASVHTTISHLLREIGQRTKSKYKVGKTVTSSIDVVPALELLGIEHDDYTLPTFKVPVMDKLKNGYQIIAFGLNQTDSIGHAWHIDGYRAYDIHVLEQTCENPLSPYSLWKTIRDLGVQNIRLYHMNWGENGMGNGYYNAGVYDGDNPYSLDNKDKGKYPYKYESVGFLPLYHKRNFSYTQF